jgi:hypothetical protein
LSNYTKTTNFASKDNLSPGNPLKIVKGTEIDTEYNNIATAVATKTDNASAAITGGTITGITDLAVADGGTGASTAAAALNNLLPSQTSAANKYLQSDGTNASWDAVSLSTSDITGTLPVANGGTGVTSSTGTGSVVLSNSPTLVTPALGTPSALVGTNITGTASGLTAGNVTTNANLTGDVTSVGNATTLTNAPVIAKVLTGYVSGAGTVAATDSILQAIQKLNGNDATNANLTGMVTSVGNATTVVTNANLTGAVTSSGNATSLGSFSSANLLAALTDETGTGSAVFATSPTLVTPILGTPTSATLTNATGLPLTTGVTGQLPVANGGTGTATPSIVAGTNVTVTGTWPNQTIAASGGGGTPGGSTTQVQYNNAGAFGGITGATTDGTSLTLVAPVLGTPASGTVTNLTGTASININGTVGATTASTGAFTTLTTSSTVTHNGGTANGVTYLNGSKVLTSGSALTFDGTDLVVGNSGLTGDRIIRMVNSTGNSTFGTYGGSGYGPLTSGDANIYTSKNIVLMADDAAGSIKFSAGGNTERMRLTSTGLGIGTSSPETKLQVVSSGATSATISAYDATASKVFIQAGGSQYIQVGTTSSATFINDFFGAGLSFRMADSQKMLLDGSGNLGLGVTPSANQGRIQANGSGQSWFKFYDSSTGWNFGTFYKANGTSPLAYMGAGGGNAISGATVDDFAMRIEGSFVIATGGGTERARIDSSGNLLVGTTSTGLSNANSLSLEPSASGAAFVNHANGSSSGNGYIFFGYNGSAIGSITQSGTTAVLYNVTSDQRLKENIQDADSASNLIDFLQVRKFDWKTDQTHQRYGFVAQELVTVYPEAVHQPNDTEDMMAVDYSKLVPMLVKEIQSLRQRLSAANL